jgi:DNA-binding response OmpR family regulator
MTSFHESPSMVERRSRQRRRAILVDEDMEARLQARLLLEFQGFDVDEVCDGMEAIELVMKARPVLDLAILEYKLPVLNGIETLDALRRLQPGLLAILCSEDYDRACLYGRTLEGVQFLRKPCEAGDLDRALKRLARQTPSRRARAAQVRRQPLPEAFPQYPFW